MYPKTYKKNRNNSSRKNNGTYRSRLVLCSQNFSQKLDRVLILKALVLNVLGSVEGWVVPASSTFMSAISKEGDEQFPIELLDREPLLRGESFIGEWPVEQGESGERGGVLGSQRATLANPCHTFLVFQLSFLIRNNLIHRPLPVSKRTLKFNTKFTFKGGLTIDCQFLI